MEHNGVGTSVSSTVLSRQYDVLVMSLLARANQQCPGPMGVLSPRDYDPTYVVVVALK
jgi:hypothetical protein